MVDIEGMGTEEVIITEEEDEVETEGTEEEIEEVNINSS